MKTSGPAESTTRSAACEPTSDQQARVVHDVHRLQTEAAVARNCKNRQMPQQPGDVVDQDIPFAEEEGRPHDPVGEARRSHRLFQRGLAPVVAGGGFGRVGNACLDDATYPRSPGRIDQPPGVLDGDLMGQVTVWRAHPVGVVERVAAGQGRDQGSIVGKVKRIGRNA